MKNSLVPDEKIPKYLRYNNKNWVVVEKMQNFHYRVLVFSLGETVPKWLSNDEIKKILKLNE